VIEVMVGVVLTAVATGLVFTKFSTPRPRFFFARYAVITPFDGVPMLMVRVGNDRGDHVVDARMRMVLTRTEKTTEGVTFYRSRDLRLVREHSVGFRRGTTLMHRIDETSPLFGATPESLAATDSEIIVSLVGVDGTTSQVVHAGGSYLDDEVRFGHRYADTVRELTDGRIELDVRRFHDTIPTKPIEGFPYPRDASGADDAS
jgi:inward rectifier potassium channel